MQKQRKRQEAASIAIASSQPKRSMLAVLVALPSLLPSSRPVLVRRSRPPLASAVEDSLSMEDYDGCLVPEQQPSREEASWRGITYGSAYDAALFSVPAVVPLLAYNLYPLVMDAYHVVVDVISGKTWYSVDGGASRIAELMPVTNGIVVPSVSVAFGTLTAITIQSLRQRQISIRALLNKEACTMRSLHSSTSAIFKPSAFELERFQLALLMRQYLSRLIFESRNGINLQQLERLGASDSEVDGMAQVLFQAEARPIEPTESRMLFQSNTEFTAMLLIKELQVHRSERLALLQTPFPAVHWLILTLLASSILLAFIFETDAQLLQFLDDLQLRYLFTVLVGAFSGIAALCADLADPFRGSFCITPSTQQLECVRDIILQESCGGSFGKQQGKQSGGGLSTPTTPPSSSVVVPGAGSEPS